MDGWLGIEQPREGELQPVDRPSSPHSGHLFPTMGAAAAAAAALGGVMFITSLMVGNIIHPTLGKQAVDEFLGNLPIAIARECEDVILDSRSQIHHLIEADDFGHLKNFASRNHITSGPDGNDFSEDICTFRVHEHDGKIRAHIGFGTVQRHYAGDGSVQLAIHEGESAETSQKDTSLSLQLDKKFDNFQGKSSRDSLFWPRDRHPNYIHESQEAPQEGLRSLFRAIPSIFGFHPKLDVDESWKKSSSDAVISAAQNLQAMAEKRLQDEIRSEKVNLQ